MQKNGRQILIVEDDKQLNDLLCAYARLAGFSHLSALDGSAALSQARAHPPALILLDVMLPDLDGFEVLRQLKQEEQTASIPIVMLTALDREEYRQRGLRSGAAAYLTKPFDPDRLMATLRSHALTDPASSASPSSPSFSPPSSP